MVVLVALMERDSFVKVFGKSLSSCTVIFVFRTGDTDAGINLVLDFISVFIMKVSEFVTVCPLISIVIDRD